MATESKVEFVTRETNGTVGELIHALSQYPPHTQVVAADSDLRWRLVWTVAKPYGNDPLSAAVALSFGKVIG